MQTFLSRLLQSLAIGMLLFSSNVLLAQNAVLKHSYTFNDGKPADLVGEANGIIHGGATIKDGMYIANERGQYIELPAQKININTYKALSIETVISNDIKNDAYTMFSYFGNTTGDNGSDYLFQSIWHDGTSKVAISCKNTSSPWEGESVVHSRIFNDEKKHYLVTTFDNNEVKFYIDGVLAGIQTNDQMPENVISNIGNTLAFIGKSGYKTDPTWQGMIYEFNIYEGVLDSASIVQSAKRFLPNWNYADAKKFLGESVSNMIVDASDLLDKPVTDKAVYFAELIPTEDDNNNCVDECFVFSDAPLNDWTDFSAAIIFSSYNGYVDVWDTDGNISESDVKMEIAIGHVYQCWIELNVPENKYSVYVKSDDQKKPVVIRKDATFQKKVTELNRWSSIYNRDAQIDELVTNAISPVSKVGELPSNYSKSESATKKESVLNEKAPKGALVIENPIHGFQTGTLDIKRLVVTNEETALYLRCFHSPGNSVSIPEKTFIKLNDSEEKLYLKETKGMPIETWYFPSAKGYTDVKLVFPAIDANSSSFEYSEENGSWHVYDIQLKSKDDLSQNLLAGSWFNTNSGDWEFSYLDSVVIYNSKVWQVSSSMPTKKKGVLNLSNEDEKISLIYHLKKDELLIGENEMHELGQDSRYENVEKPSNPPVFKKPLLKMDTAVLSGYYSGYDTRIGFETGMIYVDNIFTGNQESYIIRIEENGYFKVKIPLLYPHVAYLRMNSASNTVFLEPGKEVFTLIDLRKGTIPNFMGDNARLNSELNSNIDEKLYMNKFYNEIYNKILDMSPVEFKVFNLSKSHDDLNILNTLYTKGKMSDRYFQVMKTEIPCYYARNILHYHYTSQSAYREKHSVPRDQRLPVTFKVPSEPEFYEFLDADFINDELTLLSSSFENFMNAFIYSPVLRSTKNTWYDLLKYVYDAEKYKDEDKAFVEEFLNCFTPEFIDQQYDFYTTVGGSESQFQKDYAKELDSIQKKNPDEVALSILVKQVSQSDSLSEGYRKYCEKAIQFYSHGAVIKATWFLKKSGEGVRKLINDYSVYKASSQIHSRNRVLVEDLNIPKGLVSDIILSQNVLSDVVEKYTPLSDDELKQSQSEIQNEFIRDYFTKANEATLAKIEANKKKGGYTYNEVPNAEADKLFEAIVSKYKGNVVYIDFWATWCGPCRSSMKNQAQMKEDLADKNIKFVYITSPSSPEQTYNNMIPDIKGEHYRVSKDEWNYLCDKFKISGIPHYAIVDKEGNIVDPNATRNPSDLIPKFEELMNQN